MSLEGGREEREVGRVREGGEGGWGREGGREVGEGGREREGWKEGGREGRDRRSIVPRRLHAEQWYVITSAVTWTSGVSE